MTNGFKHKLFAVLEGDSDDRASRLFAAGMMTLIVLNVLAVVLESEDVLAERYHALFWGFEVLSVVVFTLEYLLRVWTCTDAPAARHAMRDRVRFVCSPLAIVDLAAVAPFYLAQLWSGGLDLRFLRTMRLFRLVRVLKLGRYSAAITTLRNVLVGKKEELAVSVLAILLLMLLGSALLYFAERDAQPGAFASIRDAFWWAILTLSTVSYVDAQPITPGGRTLGVLLALLNVALLAVPTGILGSGFVEEFQRRREPRNCPSCGASIMEAAPGAAATDEPGPADEQVAKQDSLRSA